jgi:signal transduction histidine kinase
MRPEAVDVVGLVGEVIDEQRDQAQERGIQIVCTATAPFPACLDAEILRQVIGNLVSNAVRYNRPQGRVLITLTALPAARVAIAVEDNGIGVPLEHRERIFERFYRVDAHRSRQTGGTGLGLAIVKHLVQSMGGTVTFQPAAGEGSVFTVVVPTDLPMRPVASPA